MITEKWSSRLTQKFLCAKSSFLWCIYVHLMIFGCNKWLKCLYIDLDCVQFAKNKSTTFPKNGGTAYIFKYNHIYHISSSRIKKHICVTFLSLTPRMFIPKKSNVFFHIRSDLWGLWMWINIGRKMPLCWRQGLRFGRWSKNPVTDLVGVFLGAKKIGHQKQRFLQNLPCELCIYIYIP